MTSPLRSTPTVADLEEVRRIVSATGFFRAAEVDIAVELVEDALERGAEASGYHFLFFDEGAAPIPSDGAGSPLGGGGSLPHGAGSTPHGAGSSLHGAGSSPHGVGPPPTNSGDRVRPAAQRVLGYACYGPIDGTESSWDFYWIAVDPTAQGRGIGQELLRAAEVDAHARGAARFWVETSTQPLYAPTRRFYHAAGYTDAATLEDFYAPGDGKLVLVKRLRG